MIKNNMRMELLLTGMLNTRLITCKNIDEKLSDEGIFYKRWIHSYYVIENTVENEKLYF